MRAAIAKVVKVRMMKTKSKTKTKKKKVRAVTQKSRRNQSHRSHQIAKKKMDPTLLATFALRMTVPSDLSSSGKMATLLSSNNQVLLHSSAITQSSAILCQSTRQTVAGKRAGWKPVARLMRC